MYRGVIRAQTQVSLILKLWVCWFYTRARVVDWASGDNGPIPMSRLTDFVARSREIIKAFRLNVEFQRA